MNIAKYFTWANGLCTKSRVRGALGRDTHFNSTQFAVYNGTSYDYKNATVTKLLALQWWWSVTVKTFNLIIVVIVMTTIQPLLCDLLLAPGNKATFNKNIFVSRFVVHVVLTYPLQYTCIFNFIFKQQNSKPGRVSFLYRHYSMQLHNQYMKGICRLLILVNEN